MHRLLLICRVLCCFPWWSLLVSLHQWGLNGAVDCGARMFFVLLLSLVINYECFFLSFFQGIDSHLLNPRVLDTQILCLASSSLVSRLSSLKNKIKQWHVHLVNLLYIYIYMSWTFGFKIYIYFYIYKYMGNVLLAPIQNIWHDRWTTKGRGGSGMEMPDTCHILSSQKPNKKIGKEFSTTRGPNLFDSKLTAYAGLIYTYIPWWAFTTQGSPYILLLFSKLIY